MMPPKNEYFVSLVKASVGPNQQVIDPGFLSAMTQGNFASMGESFVVRCPNVEVPDLPDSPYASELFELVAETARVAYTQIPEYRQRGSTQSQNRFVSEESLLREA
jgi:hypothetical protein